MLSGTATSVSNDFLILGTCPDGRVTADVRWCIAGSDMMLHTRERHARNQIYARDFVRGLLPPLVRALSSA